MHLVRARSSRFSSEGSAIFLSYGGERLAIFLAELRLFFFFFSPFSPLLFSDIEVPPEGRSGVEKSEWMKLIWIERRSSMLSEFYSSSPAIIRALYAYVQVSFFFFIDIKTFAVNYLHLPVMSIFSKMMEKHALKIHFNFLCFLSYLPFIQNPHRKCEKNLTRKRIGKLDQTRRRIPRSRSFDASKIKKKKNRVDPKITRHANASKVEKRNRGARRGKGVEEITRRGWQGRAKDIGRAWN